LEKLSKGSVIGRGVEWPAEEPIPSSLPKSSFALGANAFAHRRRAPLGQAARPVHYPALGRLKCLGVVNCGRGFAL
jgi:hypothetical protein